jgi:MFS transporter, DHA2 family, multidrug resistance protein
MTETGEAAADEGLPTPRRHYAALAIAASMVLVVLDGAIANVALPTLAVSFRVSAAASVWVVSGYQLALVMTLLPCAALGASVGLKRTFIAGVFLFTAASLLCAFSPSLRWLVAARFLQGLGAAGVMSLGVALLRITYPKSLLGGALGWYALIVALAAAAGPTVGSAIIVTAGWRWLFAINLPVGAIVLAATAALPHPAGSGQRIGIVDAGLNAVAFALFFLAVDRIVEQTSVAILLILLCAAAFMTLLYRERGLAAPMLPVDLLRIPAFRRSVVASLCCFIGQMAGLIALPFYFQHNLHQSPLTTGLYLTPWPLSVAIVGPLSGKWADRLSNARLCGIGGVLLACGLALGALWRFDGALWPYVPILMLTGVGFGLFQTPNNRNMLLSIPAERSGAAGGMQALSRLVGQTMGSMLIAVLLAQVSTAAAPRISLLIGSAFALAAGLVSLKPIKPRRSFP